MNQRNKIIRAMLGILDKDSAFRILDADLPPEERDAIFYNDVMGEDINFIKDIRLHYSERKIQELKERGYDRIIAAHFFTKK